jgi:hypothetical protein
MPQEHFLPFLNSFGTKQSRELKLRQLDTQPICFQHGTAHKGIT